MDATTDEAGWAGGFPPPRWFAAAAKQWLMDGPGGPGPWAGHHHRRRARPGFGPPPFGWGPWLAGGPPRGGRRSRRGDVRLAVLRLLDEQPMHGYQIITELVERSNGAWQPSPGSIYPTLQQLTDEGLVTVAESDGRRTYALTEAGRAELERVADGRRAPWEEMAADLDDEAGRLRQSGARLMAAVMQVAASGSAAQADRAEALLGECRRALYRLLAEEDETSEEG